MSFRWGLLAPCIACLTLPLWPAVAAQAQDKSATAAQLEFFEKSVRPILAANCFDCHGPDKQKGGLRLDSRAAMMEGGDTGPAMMPGNPKASLLITAIHYEGAPKMPPKGKLTEAEIAALTEWIQHGAPWPQTVAAIRAAPAKGFTIQPRDREFWSFKLLADAAAPPAKNKAWPQSPIDNFILAPLDAAGLQPAAPADKRTLIRRVSFDLIGLPPTSEEIDAFLKDDAPDAFAKVVDRLLASPHYGERWARHWLDVARYGEDQAHTFEARKYPQGFRYRDWLIKAFNDDMPYDRFLIEQIAADLLKEPDRLENLPALGFFATGPVYYGDPKKLDQYDDRIDTLTRGLLGLTVACARCHDHKYDPISSKDYYALAGIFASTDYVEISLEPGNEGKVLVPPPKNAKDPKDKKKPLAKGPHIHAIKDAKPQTLKIHIRGNPATLGEEAHKRFLSILGGDDAHPFPSSGSGRLELALAIASKDNPLTARVMVNRVWQQHFGKALVRTPSNFGALGEKPTHPELLDFLARRFIDSGWSLKSLHRDIVLSATYQMSSHFDGRGYDLDPDNKLLWRMNRNRLDVEAWRDAMLAVAGTLDPTIGGPSFDLNAADNRRRTLYGAVSRHDLNGLLRLFDFPDPNITSEKRTETTVPLQQLFVLNSEFMVRNAKALAGRLTRNAELTDAQHIAAAYLLVYGRAATEREVQIGQTFLAAPPMTSTKGPTLTRWEQYTQVLLAANEFMYVD